MPRAAVCVVVVTRERFCERAVNLAAPAGRRRLVHGGSHHGMPELEPVPVRDDKAGLLRGVDRPRVRAEELCGLNEENGVLRVVRRCQQQHELRLVRQPLHALEEDGLDPTSERKRIRKRLMPGELSSAERGRQLDERQRVTARLLDQAPADRVRRFPGHP